MKLIFGLGNIGAQFDGTRHNVGFAILDSLTVIKDSHHLQSTDWAEKPKFKAHIAEVSINGEKMLLVKPTTYYNQAGETLQSLKSFYKLQNSDILIIHDELALPFGTVRTRLKGSDAGNNGLKSIIAHIGADVARVRIGIANDLSEKMDAADFVLARFTQDEATKLPEIITTAQKCITTFVSDAGTFEHTSIKV